MYCPRMVPTVKIPDVLNRSDTHFTVRLKRVSEREKKISFLIVSFTIPVRRDEETLERTSSEKQTRFIYLL